MSGRNVRYALREITEVRNRLAAARVDNLGLPEGLARLVSLLGAAIVAAFNDEHPLAREFRALPVAPGSATGKLHRLDAENYIRSVSDLAHRAALFLETKEDEEVSDQDSIASRIFLVHGRDGRRTNALLTLIRAVGVHPIEWNEAVALTGQTSPYVADVITAGFGAARAVVVLLTGDDLARLDGRFVRPEDPVYERELTPQARPNVIFEAGMALGMQPGRTILVEIGRLRPFSDVGGRHVVRLTNDAQSRHSFVERLKVAGCRVSTVGSDWLSAGDFGDSVGS